MNSTNQYMSNEMSQSGQQSPVAGGEVDPFTTYTQQGQQATPVQQTPSPQAHSTPQQQTPPAMHPGKALDPKPSYMSTPSIDQQIQSRFSSYSQTAQVQTPPQHSQQVQQTQGAPVPQQVHPMQGQQVQQVQQVQQMQGQQVHQVQPGQQVQQMQPIQQVQQVQQMQQVQGTPVQQYPQQAATYYVPPTSGTPPQQIYQPSVMDAYIGLDGLQNQGVDISDPKYVNYVRFISANGGNAQFTPEQQHIVTRVYGRHTALVAKKQQQQQQQQHYMAGQPPQVQPGATPPGSSPALISSAQAGVPPTMSQQMGVAPRQSYVFTQPVTLTPEQSETLKRQIEVLRLLQASKPLTPELLAHLGIGPKPVAVQAQPGNVVQPGQAPPQVAVPVAQIPPGGAGQAPQPAQGNAITPQHQQWLINQQIQIKNMQIQQQQLQNHMQMQLQLLNTDPSKVLGYDTLKRFPIDPQFLSEANEGFVKTLIKNRTNELREITSPLFAESQKSVVPVDNEASVGTGGSSTSTASEQGEIKEVDEVILNQEEEEQEEQVKEEKLEETEKKEEDKDMMNIDEQQMKPIEESGTTTVQPTEEEAREVGEKLIEGETVESSTSTSNEGEGEAEEKEKEKEIEKVINTDTTITSSTPPTVTSTVDLENNANIDDIVNSSNVHNNEYLVSLQTSNENSDEPQQQQPQPPKEEEEEEEEEIVTNVDDKLLEPNESDKMEEDSATTSTTITVDENAQTTQPIDDDEDKMIVEEKEEEGSSATIKEQTSIVITNTSDNTTASATGNPATAKPLTITNILANISGTPDYNQKINNLLEYKQLTLLDLQKKVRAEVVEFSEREIIADSRGLDIFRKPINQFINTPKKSIKGKIPEAVDVNREFINAVLQHGKEFKEWHANKYARCKKMTKRVTTWFILQEKKEAQLREKEERERLRALKTNDESKYIKLLEQTKNKRLRELFDQTNEFLDKISHLLQKEKTMIEEEEESEEATKKLLEKQKEMENTNNNNSNNTTAAASSAMKIDSILDSNDSETTSLPTKSELESSLSNNSISSIVSSSTPPIVSPKLQSVSLNGEEVSQPTSTTPSTDVTMTDTSAQPTDTAESKPTTITTTTITTTTSIPVTTTDTSTQPTDNTTAITTTATTAANPQSTTFVSKAHSYYSKAHSITEEIIEQPTLLEGGQLKPYQIQGLQWLVSLYNNKLNGILADEMGLGKTIQTIALVTYLIEKKKNNGPYLIIVPLSTLTNWKQEFNKWAPKVKSIAYYGTREGRKSTYEAEIAPGQFNAVITTYEYIIKDKNLLSKIKWSYMIVDEGHRMKNNASKLSMTLGNSYHARYRLLLTGTPLQNSLPELWSLLNFLLPNIFDCVEDFEQWFNAPFAQSGEKIEMSEEEQLLIIHRLHKVLRPFLLRRLKKEVEAQLPDKVEKVLKCGMSAFQSKMYHLIKSKGVAKFSTGNGDDGPKLSKGLKNTYVQLRKICNHPYLLYVDDIPVDNNLIRYAGKFDLLDRLLPKLKASGHRVLIFSQMTTLIDILELFFAYRGFKYLRLDGSTKSEERGPLLDLFNAPNSDYFIFVLSTRAGGLGLNLQTADTVIIFDSDWNPQMDLQAQDRAHRIGQKQTVRVLRLVTAQSVEENILARANYKKDLDKKIIQAGQFNNKSSRSDRKKMLEDLMTQDETAEMERQGIPTDQQINEMIARSGEEFELFEKMDKDRFDAEFKLWQEAGKPGDPQRLCTEEEMPEWITKEIDVDDDFNFVNSNGKTKKIDSFDDDKKLMKFISVGGEITRRRAASVAINLETYDDEEEDEEEGTTNNANNETDSEPSPSSSDDDDDDYVEPEQKPKRTPKNSKRKEMSTPRNDEDEDHVSNTRSSRSASKVDKDDYEDDSEDQVTTKRPKKKTKYTPKKNSKASAAHTATVISTPNSSLMSPEGGVPPVPTPPAKKAGRGRPAGSLKKKPTTENEIKYLALWEVLRSCLDEEGRKRSEIFLKLPSKREYPDYYAIIKTPIDMKIIRDNIVNHKFSGPEEFAKQVNTMYYNAQIYNDSDSLVYEDAVHLQKLFTVEFNRSFPNSMLPDPQPPLSPTVSAQYANQIPAMIPAVAATPVNTNVSINREMNDINNQNGGHPNNNIQNIINTPPKSPPANYKHMYPATPNHNNNGGGGINSFNPMSLSSITNTSPTIVKKPPPLVMNNNLNLIMNSMQNNQNRPNPPPVSIPVNPNQNNVKRASSYIDDFDDEDSGELDEDEREEDYEN